MQMVYIKKPLLKNENKESLRKYMWTPTPGHQRKGQSNSGLEYGKWHPEIWELCPGDDLQLWRVQTWDTQSDLWLQSYVQEIYLEVEERKIASVSVSACKPLRNG